MAPPLRVVFAGTPTFAAQALQAILDAGHAVPLVLTQPDRPAGRGMKLQPSAVKQTALAHGLAVAQPAGLRLNGRFAQDAHAARDALLAAQPDVMVVAAYGLILPDWVLTLPRLGCLNIHASLLPRWRGAAPIHRAIEAGDAETGITIMQMDAGLDTGDALLVGRVPVAPHDTTGSLHDRLALLGGALMIEALTMAAQGQLRPQPQPSEGVTYAHKIDKAESLIDWALPAAVIERRVRAFDPFPGCVTDCQGEPIKVWASHIADAPAPQGPPGAVMAVDAQGVWVATGDGTLILTELQRAGGKRLPVAAFLQGFPMQPGVRLGTAGAA